MAPTLVRRRGSAKTDAFVLGVLSSIPFDWIARRWVEGHMKFGVLGPLPVPELRVGSRLGERVVELAGQLAAVDGRYRDWAVEVGVEVGTAAEEPMKTALIVELDATVSVLYGLQRDQIEHLFATFHRGWDYRGRLDAVLAHYENWKSAS